MRFEKEQLQAIGINVDAWTPLNIKTTFVVLQAAGRFQQFYACDGKDKYSCALAATKRAYNLSGHRGKEFEVYRCIFCGFFHIGRMADRRRFERIYPIELDNGRYYVYDALWYNRYGPFATKEEACKFAQKYDGQL